MKESKDDIKGCFVLKKIAIIVLSSNWDSAYSVASVVKTQIRSLVRAGYSPRVLLLKSSPPWILRSKVDYRMCLPNVKYDEHNGKANAQFFKGVHSISRALEKNLQGIDIVLSHDLLYLRLLLPYNLAVRIVGQKLKKLHWLHWAHSSPFSRPRRKIGYPYNMLYRDMPRSRFVSVTKAQARGYARRYAVADSKVVTVYNPRATQDFMTLGPIVRKLVEKYRLFEADIVAVMPTVLSRIHKQQEVTLYLIAALKDAGKKVRLVFADAYALRRKDNEGVRMLQLKWLSRKLGLSEGEVVFTSETNTKLKDGCPAKVIKELLQISNVYIHPSGYETGSLALMEAALTKNLCIINKDLASIKEIVKKDALWLKFDSVVRAIKKKYKIRRLKDGFYKYFYSYYQDNRASFKAYARKIINTLEEDRSLSLFSRVKKELNEQIIFETQLKPLLEE